MSQNNEEMSSFFQFPKFEMRTGTFSSSQKEGFGNNFSKNFVNCQEITGK
jgi:hypothetical protein